MEILGKHPQRRSAKDITVLVEASKDIAFFVKMRQDVGQDAHKLCCSHFKYEHFKTGHYVFHQGDRGTKFYVLLEGKISVKIAKSPDEEGT